jgi:fucose 4-O-acetylase-like acetyltransferase
MWLYLYFTQIEPCGICKTFSIIGQHTLFILCVHHTYWIFMRFWNIQSNVGRCVVKTSYALFMLVIYLLVKRIYTKRINN